MENTKTMAEAEAVAKVVKKAFKPRVVPLGANGEPSAMILPEGTELVSLKEMVDEYRDAPERREGTAKLEDLPSFIAHAKRFADADSAVFASPDPQSPKMVSVLDYHRSGADSSPRFGKHRGLYSFPLSDEWKLWTGNANKPMHQVAFAEFIESNILHVADPALAGETARAFSSTLKCELASPGRLMELSKGLSIRVASRVTNAHNLRSGEAEIQYSTEHQDESGKPLAVPGAFLLALRVYRGGDLYQVPVRLRYRLKEQAITWFYDLWRTDLVFEDAFKGACSQVQEGTGLPLFIGTPE